MRVHVLRILYLSDRRTCLQSDFAPLGSKQCALGYRCLTNRLEGTVLRGLLFVSHLLTSFRCGGVGELTPLAASVALLGFDDLDGPEAFDRAVDEEDLHRDVGLDMGLAEKREDFTPG